MALSKDSDTDDCQFDKTNSVKPAESIQGPDRQLMRVSVVAESDALSKIDKFVHVLSDRVSWMASTSEEHVTSCGVSDEVMLMLLMVRVAALVNNWAKDGSGKREKGGQLCKM